MNAIALAGLSTALLAVACTVAVLGQESRPAPPSPTAATQAAPQEIFSKEIAPKQKIVVTREPFDVKLLGILDNQMAKQGATTACIRIELRVEGGQSILLGSAIQSDFPKDFRTGFEVVDVFCGEDELVVACTVADLLGLWRMSLDAHRNLPDGWTCVRPGMGAVRKRLAANQISIFMTPAEKEPREQQRWSLTITDNREPKPTITQYKQAEDAWRFSPMKEDAPPARPIKPNAPPPPAI